MMMFILSVFISGAVLTNPVDAAKEIDKGRIWCNGNYYNYFTTYYDKNFLVIDIYYKGVTQVNKIKVSKYKYGKVYKNKIYIENKRSNRYNIDARVSELNNKQSTKEYYNKHIKKNLKKGKLPSNVIIGVPNSQNHRSFVNMRY